ncbi:putative vacuolar membrane transporter for cationic amino acids [Podospora pseudopauciseta]|uniref:Vacuolar membrane transporter for cationic amino acids n=1 Tax=Podospora pseudopauciseta TaxID=2093780 RepID=A0ABR0H0J2_9PEZI|nr:putative vacuolar membrane transporter for cationic amino acids [Podospora pseudopauciseta]
MAPPTAPLNLDVEAISGICGSISIACWVVVFSPQIIENFRRSSADGLSIQFIVVWLLGDVFNILGAVMQGVLPTMIILAIYYTIADIVLLGQCFYYRGFTLSDDPVAPAPAPALPKTTSTTARNGADEIGERSGLLSGSEGVYGSAGELERRGSWTHLSPAVPMIDVEEGAGGQGQKVRASPPTRLQSLGFNSSAVLMVCAAGVGGWWLSRGYGGNEEKGGKGEEDPLQMDFWGQVFGWLCAVLYLGSRLPQLLLNWRRKSTEGVSILFFLFACLGNLTYVLSILAYDPVCGEDVECKDGEAARIYWQYVLVNLSWLAGSAGTLFLDMSIFVQFFLYSKGDEEDEESDDEGSVSGSEDEDDEESIAGDRWDQRPVLERGVSNYA